MALGKNQITLVFAGDASKLDRTFKQVGNESRTMADRIGLSTAALKKMALAGIAAGAVAGALAVKFGVDSVKAYAEAETAQLKLEDAYKRFPKLADTNIDSLRKLNTELAKKTRFDDDATASAEAVLAQYKLTGKQIQTLIPLVQDYAAKTGKDLPDAAGILGKALLGKGKALAEIGIKFKDTGTVAGNFAQIVAGLRTQVGGFAEQEGQTAAGKLEILKNKFGEIKEAVGGLLLPVVSGATDVLSNFADVGQTKVGELAESVSKFDSEELSDLKQSLGDVANQIGGAVNDSFTMFKQFLSDNKEEVKKFTKEVNAFTKDTGPILVFIIKSTAVQLMETARAVMFLVDQLDRLRAWYTKNLSWLNPFAAVIDKFSSGPVLSQGGLMPPRHHAGLPTVPGAPGSQMLAVLQAGERVTPAGAGGPAVIEIRSSGSDVDDLLVRILQRAIKVRGGNVQLALGR